LQILAGMIGDRKPDSALFEPSWHHIYAILGWTELAPVKGEPLYYPPTESERSELARAIFAIVEDGAARAAFNSDRDGYAARFDLDVEERDALVALDRDALRERLGINPMLLYQLEARAGSK
jgi:2,3-dihydroxyphenylpropionate 1,2-dioxygenase